MDGPEMLMNGPEMFDNGPRMLVDRLWTLLNGPTSPTLSQ